MTDEPGVDPPSRGAGSWALGAALCVLFAGLVAACGLTSSGDDDADATPATQQESPSTDTPTTEHDDGHGPDATDAPEATDVPDSDSTTGGAGAGPVSFASNVQPIITETCASCHTGDGPGTQHVRFDTAQDVADADISLVIETKFMPPWPAGDASVDFERDWSLTDEEIAGILDWHAAGSPLDVAADTPIVPANGVIGIDDPDVTALASGSYDGSPETEDIYRCFVYDPEVEERSFASKMEFIPDQTEVVHHAVGFLLSAEDRAEVDEIDGADGNGGWTCFGFSPGRSAQLIFTWAPGTDPTEFPEGSGLEVQPGDFFVMQTHFHYDIDAPGDRSTFAIEWSDAEDPVAIELNTYLAPAEIPCRGDETGPLCDRDAARAKAVEAYGPAGVLADALLAVCGKTVDDFAGMTDGIASASCDSRVGSPGTIVSVFGHEHELGKSFRLTINPDTPDEVVLLDIPDWDFDWQLIYEPVDDIRLERGDTIRVECVWDRSRRDPALEPAYVLWADGTDDEMCFSTIVTMPLDG